VGQEFQKRSEEGTPADDILELVDIIVPFNMHHNAEHEAIDLLMEVDKLNKVIDHVDDGNLERVCLYLKSCADYVPEPEDTHVLRVTLEIYKKLNRHPAALHMAIRLNDVNEIRAIYESCPDACDSRPRSFDEFLALSPFSRF
jgi:26S proteasome regulatory subunit N1